MTVASWAACQAACSASGQSMPGSPITIELPNARPRRPSGRATDTVKRGREGAASRVASRASAITASSSAGIGGSASRSGSSSSAAARRTSAIGPARTVSASASTLATSSRSRAASSRAPARVHAPLESKTHARPCALASTSCVVAARAMTETSSPSDRAAAGPSALAANAIHAEEWHDAARPGASTCARTWKTLSVQLETRLTVIRSDPRRCRSASPSHTSLASTP
ncbi:MAG: hypothetical protein BGO98_45480 [Myxococcales bacterium 68-20]|nr:MAG: hypothetical protein BGO98_45480 [Myxococcales bacterium 68-20]